MKPRAILELLLFGCVAVFCMGADGSHSNGSSDLVALLREFGFPIFVSLWFMWRVEKRMDRFTDSIQNLLTAITVMAKTIDSISPGRNATPYQPPALPPAQPPHP